MLRGPLHPYTHALLSTLPRLDNVGRSLSAIPGSPPDLFQQAEHCPFIPRCTKVMNVCRQEPRPGLGKWEHATHPVACYNPIWQIE
jgi:oligopeptide/dipeptide ABC transporter ATP-binding protein